MNAHEMTFKDFEVGDVLSFTRCFTLKDFESFSTLSGDTNPMHGDPDYAAQSAHGKPTVPLQLVAAPLSAVAGAGFGCHRSVCLTTKLKSVEPVYYDQDITYSARIIGKHSGSSTLTLSVICFKERRVLLDAEMVVQIREDMPTAAAASEPLQIEPASRKKSALLTGATGPIGRATARRLARSGWDLALQFNTNQQIADQLKEELSKGGIRVEVFQASLDDRQQTARLVESVNRELSPVAFLHLASPPLDVSAAAQFSVNYEACQQIMNGLLPDMLRRQEGTLLILAGGGAQQGQPGWEDFVATKNAASGFARQIGGRFATYGIRGKTIAAGFVDTSYSQGHRPQDARVLLAEEVAEAIVGHLENVAPTSPDHLLLEPGFEGGRYLSYGQTGPQNVTETTREQSNQIDIGEEGAQFAPAQFNGANRGQVEPLVREFFKLAPSLELMGGGLGSTPGWDSLAHIELMMFLETRLGIAFTSREIASGTSMQMLASIAERKLI